MSDPTVITWQEETTNIRERLLHVIRKGLQSDLTIQIDNDEFQVHKLILSMSSSVFYEKLYTLDNNGLLVMNDISPHIFSKFISYMYKDEIDFCSVMEAFQLLEAAEKYKMTHLKNMSVRYLTERIGVHAVPSLWRLAVEYKAVELAESCFQYFVQTTKDCLEMASVWSLPEECVIKILQQPTLKAKEITLFNFVYNWVASKLDVEGRSHSLENIRKKMEPFISLIHFHEMKKEDINSFVIPKGILTDDEIFKIKQNNPEFRLPVKILPKCRGEQSKYSMMLSNVTYILIIASKSGFVDLSASCLQYIAENANEVFRMNGFLKLSDCLVIDVLKQKNLRATEGDLFEAVCFWACNQVCDSNPPSVAELRSKLEKFLPFIHFGEMHPSKLHEINATGVFTQEEFFSYLQTCQANQTANYPPKYRSEVFWLCKRSDGGSTWTPVSELVSFHSLFFRINSTFDCCFCGFRLTNRFARQDNTEMKVLLNVEGSIMEISNSNIMTIFSADVTYPYDIIFSKRVTLKAGTIYKFSINVKVMGEPGFFFVETYYCNKIVEDVYMKLEFLDDPSSQFTYSEGGLIYYFYFWR